jgi:hypothetical protein
MPEPQTIDEKKNRLEALRRLYNDLTAYEARYGSRWDRKETATMHGALVRLIKSAQGEIDELEANQLTLPGVIPPRRSGA